MDEKILIPAHIMKAYQQSGQYLAFKELKSKELTFKTVSAPIDCV